MAGTSEDYANWIVQNQDKQGTPEFDTIAQAYKLAKASGAGGAPDTLSGVQASAPMRFIQGMRDPIDSAAQLAAHAAPDWLINALDYFPAKMRNSDSPLLATIGDHFFADPHAGALDASIADNEKKLQAARVAATPPTLDSLVTGQKDPGFDWARLAGNVASPVNAGLAKVLPTAGAGATALWRALVGGVTGTAGGLEQPVTDGGDFWTTKAMQAGVGLVTGGATSPVLGAVMDKLAPKVATLAAKFSPAAATAMNANAATATDQAIEQALKEVGAKSEDLSAQEVAALRRQVMDSLKSGQQIDPAAALRKNDFTAAGVDPTLGQITRDATQFATERNLRGAPGVGMPLQQRFDVQNQQLQSAIGNLRGDPSEPYQAGKRLIAALQGADAPVKQGVDDLYDSARDHLGRAAPMDAYGFSQAANKALDENMLGAYLPTEARSMLNDVSSGKIPFNVNTAVQMDSVLSGAQRQAGQGTPASLAIGHVRTALNSAGIADNVGEDAKAAFDAARGAARQRFQALDAVPGMKAAVSREEPAIPDTFVRDYVINGKVEDVQRLAQVLQRNNPQAFQEARAQIGDQISRAAFGENVAGDKLAAPERLARALRTIGTDKLAAFYSPEEIGQLKTLSRVSAYINSTPSSAPVNTSNNIGAVTMLASKIPGKGAALALANSLLGSIRNANTVRAAVNAEVPQQAAKPTTDQARRIAQALMLSGVLSGQAGALPLR